ncbi:MAG: hypothetical protein QMD10_10960 [Desulfitobacteriaceae bacterium]|nr:hypothetical protein [Desulfitobacteriaceae bacterium]
MQAGGPAPRMMFQDQVWTPEEEAVVWKSVLAHYPKTYAGFKEASEKLGRSFFSVKTRFYDYLKPRLKEHAVRIKIVDDGVDPRQLTALLKDSLEKDVQKLLSKTRKELAQLREENARLKAQLADVTKKANLVDLRYIAQLAEELDLARRAVIRLQKELLALRPRAAASAS